jgi:hypothetical protein
MIRLQDFFFSKDAGELRFIILRREREKIPENTEQHKTYNSKPYSHQDTPNPRISKSFVPVTGMKRRPLVTLLLFYRCGGSKEGNSSSSYHRP